VEFCEGEGGETGGFPLVDESGTLSEGASRVSHEASMKDSSGASQMGSVQRLLTR
jgi:hypothetical protein